MLELIKKVTCVCAIALATTMQVSAYDISTFDDFASALHSTNITEIKFTNDIVGDYWIGNIAPDSLVVDGNGYSLINNDSNYIFTDGNLKLINISNIAGFNSEQGGVIYNEGLLSLENVTFSVNWAYSSQNTKGGAVLNTGGVIEIIDNASFVGNYAYSEGGKAYGGALYNSGRIETISNSSFIENSAASFDDSAQGGAIFNNKNAQIGTIQNTMFSKNEAMYGGAITNNGNNLISKIDNSNFEKNYALSQSTDAKGGAIYNDANSQIEQISNTEFVGNCAQSINKRAYGGAIFNNAYLGTLSNITFKDNKAISENDGAFGGAINNSTKGFINSIENVTFVGNSAKFGGAINNQTGSMIGTIRNATFKDNIAYAKTNTKGGAINAEATFIALIDNSTFINNTATSTGENAAAMGGAIANTNGAINVASITGDVVFSGNTANGVANALHNRASRIEYYEDGNIIDSDDIVSTINLNAGDYKVIINDGIGGHSVLTKEYYDSLNDTTTTQEEKTYANSIVNINKDDVAIDTSGSNYAPTFGIVEINNMIDGNEVNFYNGTLLLSHHKYTKEESPILAGQTGYAHFTNNSAFNIYGGSLSTMDNATFNHHLGNLTLNTDTKLSIDANLALEKIDTISVNSFNNPSNSIIDINKINIISPTKKETLELSVITPEYLNNSNIDIANANKQLAKSIKYSGGDVAYSPIYQYQVTYNNLNGSFKFDKKALNPAVVSSSVAAQSGSVATQVATFTEAFYHMDTFMTRDVNERILMRDKNKYASAYQQGMLWDDAITRRDNREAWYRPYVTIENVPLKNGPKVDNVAYGTYLGTNSPVKHLKKGWDGAWGVFLGYNGSKQSYDGVDTRQNGATLGFVGELYKKNFFTGLSINAGASMGKADTMYGTDDFNTWVGGIASKTGYNFEFKNGRYIVQPTLLLGYSFIKTMDFTNSAGVKITSEPIHSIHVEPGVKLICPRGKGWRPYAHISVVANILDKAKIKANDMPLPETSIKPYVKYGVGVQKNWTDRMTSFLQTYLTHGGRNGIGFQLGFSFLY